MATKKQPKVSIVVPIYNVERYLRECVDSILAQTLKDIEVILVDDGSPDNSGKIIDEYAAKDKRVVAVHQKNAGYSTAVNKGIDLAKSEYIGIIESDDFIEPDMYEKLYASAKKYKTDVTKGEFYYYDPTKPVGQKDKIYKNPSGIDLNNAPDEAFHITDWPYLMAFHASIWSSIYRADFVKKIKIPDTAGASYQDFPFMVEVLSKAKNISVVKKPFVHWRNEPGQGNSTSAKGKKLLFMAKNSETGLKIAKDAGVYDRVKEALIVHIVWANMGFFYNIEGKYKKEYYDILRRILLPVKDDETFKYELFQWSDKLFFNLMTKYNWPILRLSLVAMGARRKIRGAAKHLFPTYKASIQMREQMDQLIAQNTEMAKQIKELQKSTHKK